MNGRRIFAAIYEPCIAANEKAGLRDMRARLLAGARGSTLEIGAGTGLNLEHYTDAVTELVLTEPDPQMAKRLRGRLEKAPGAVASAEVVEAPAEQLPFDDARFDTVVGTLVLCSVGDPERALSEIRRVLRPGGQFLYVEHVRDAAGSRRARWQDRLEGPWAFLMGGCHPNRDSGELIARAFDVPAPAKGEFPGSGTALVKPLVSGSAGRGG